VPDGGRESCPLTVTRSARERGNAFVARDLITEEFIIARLSAGPAFQRFVADCFELDELHPLADELSGLVKPGMAHPWHFDTNEFTVSMLTQQAEGGGSSSTAPTSAQRRRRTSTMCGPCWKGREITWCAGSPCGRVISSCSRAGTRCTG
jgi:hypothetical protein